MKSKERKETEGEEKEMKRNRCKRGRPRDLKERKEKATVKIEARSNSQKSDIDLVNWASNPINLHTQAQWVQLLCTPSASPIAQAQSEMGPEESKAQLKWAPATSKDGSDQIHRHQLPWLCHPPAPDGSV
jgi:hypothetical protein